MLLSCEDDAELSEETSELLSDEISEEISEVLSEKLSELSSERKAEELSKIFSEELLVKIPELSKEISGSSEEESCCEAKHRFSVVSFCGTCTSDGETYGQKDSCKNSQTFPHLSSQPLKDGFSYQDGINFVSVYSEIAITSALPRGSAKNRD